MVDGTNGGPKNGVSREIADASFQGGTGVLGDASSDATYGAGGGAGNSGGKSIRSYSSHGQNGTGGLLVIFTNEFLNENIISSNGSNGGYAYRAGGGGSGGGSINIFYQQNS